MHFFYFSFIFVLILLHHCLGHQLDQTTRKLSLNAVEEILNKIKTISEKTLSHAPHGGKLEIIKKVEEQLTKAAKSMGKKGEKYVKLIMQGIRERALAKTSNNNTATTKDKLPSNADHSVSIEDKDNIVSENQILKNESVNIDEEVTSNATQDNTIDWTNKTDDNSHDSNKQIKLIRRLSDSRKRNILITNTKNQMTGDENPKPIQIQSLTPRYDCDGVIDRICVKIKEMKQLKCNFDDTVIPIEKLCDGVIDCPDRTDERFCTKQATERIRNANQIISETDESLELGCFPNESKESLKTTQFVILRSVLSAQQEFVEKYKYLNWSLIPSNEALQQEGSMKKTVNEVSLIISSLGLALDAALCAKHAKIVDILVARKFNDLLIEDFEKDIKELEWPPKTCNCREGRCKNKSDCTDGCKRVCWQKHSLTRWECHSINGEEFVPLGVLCDGKYDCFDESDEKGCVTGTSFAKFEANEIFKDILTSLTSKLTSKEYAIVRKTLLNLYNTVEKLQKFCMATESDLQMVRRLRNKCYSAMTSIYLEKVSKSSFPYEADEVHVFLLSLHKKFVKALKRSHTGNKRIMANEKCYCKNGKCSMAICSRNCNRVCVAKPWLTRYHCRNSSNKTVSLDDICNGKPNCPQEDDETNCKKEICRRHHLTHIRNDLQKIGKKQEGTSMGELLSAWKTKVSSALMVAENGDRPTPIIIKDIIKTILSDLVTTYGAVKDYRKINEYALEEFTNIARGVMRFIRSCGY